MSSNFWYDDDASISSEDLASGGSPSKAGSPSKIGSSSDAKRTLPSPKPATPNVADKGKVRFGAGFRLGASK